MQSIIYLIILVLITIFMLLYGGHNFRKKVTYDSKYFDIFKRVNFLCNEIKEKTLYIKNEYTGKNYIVNMTKNISCDKIIPNCVNVYIINIKPSGVINMINFMKQQNFDINTHLMIIFDYNGNHKKIYDRFLYLIIEEKYEGNYSLLHALDKKINIFDIYNIYNPTTNDVSFSLFLIKKPFWFN